MKKQLLLFCMILMPIVASADVVEIDGIYYELITKAKEAKVTHGEQKYEGEIVVPAEFTYNDVAYKVVSIGDGAFKACYGVTKVTLPSTITIIEDEGFRYCKNLTSVNISENITSIGKYAFENCKFTNITIPSSVTTLKMSVFKGCKSLESVIIDGYIETIDDNVFLYCESLTSVHIKDIALWCKNSFSDGWSNPLYYAHRLYVGDEEVTELIIPNTVDKIGNQVFIYCTSIEKVVIPNSISVIPNAFWGCTNIKSIEIPNSVTTIKGGAFGACTALTTINIPNSVINLSGFSGCENLTSVTIGNGVTCISNSAFSKCKNLIDVYCYAENVPTTAEDAFAESYIEYITLHVPVNAINNYREVVPWKDFKEIVAIGGDVNGDGLVNVTDIVATVNYIMEKPADGFNKDAADLNGDGEINVTDIVKMVTIIMSGEN